MKLEGKNILIISSESWDHLFVSKHHYAVHLTKRGNRVFFLNPPTKKNKCVESEYKNLMLVQYTGFIKGLRFFPYLFQKRIIKSKFQEIQKLCQTAFDVVWSFDNSVFFDFSALSKDVFCISHIVDLNQDFEFERSSSTADLCLASSQYILSKQKKYNNYSYFIGHGFNEEQSMRSSIELRGANRINAVYAGNLDIRYLDWDLIKQLIFDFPEVDFHFMGQWNAKNGFEDILRGPNFFYYGIIPANELNDIYMKADILLLLYNYMEFSEQLANPHKMMEYLGSGKMVVATWTDEYTDLHHKGIIKMAKNLKDFISNFKLVASETNLWNDLKSITPRVSYAQSNSYDAQITKVEDFISKIN